MSEQIKYLKPDERLTMIIEMNQAIVEMNKVIIKALATPIYLCDEDLASEND